MATQVFENEFLTRYKDDYRDSDNYYRILFNSGRSLQARELTQLQTIQQAEMGRLGRYLFKENALISGGDQTYNPSVWYVKLDTTDPTYALPTDYQSLIGTVVSTSNNIEARVKNIVVEGADNSIDPTTLVVEFISGGGNVSADLTKPVTFSKNQVLSYTTDTVSGALKILNVADAVGKSSMCSVPQSVYFALGHFVYVYAQDLVLEKYGDKPTMTVGFQLDEEIVTASDDVALYDNSGTTPNLSSPGADRYRIRLTLVRESDADDQKTFIPAFKYRDGLAVQLGGGDQALNKIGSIIANRTFEESGNYVVRGLDAIVKDDDSDENYFRVRITPGVAYVAGNRYEINNVSQDLLRIKKPRTTVKKNNQQIVADYGGYILTNKLLGLVPSVSAMSQVNLRSDSAYGGSTIGIANIWAIDKVDASNFKVHLFNIKMNSGQTIGSIKSIGTAITDYANTNRSSGTTVITEPANIAPVFLIPENRPAAMTDVVLTVVKSDFAAQTVSGGTATFTTGSASLTLSDPDKWILTYTDGTALPTQTIASGGAGSVTVTFSGLTNTKQVRLLAYVTKTGTARTKTLTTLTETKTPGADGNVTLTYPDAYVLSTVIDATTSEDVTYKYTFDNGIRDTSYEIARLILRPGFTAPAGNVNVTYNYFAHSASGDYFNIESYRSSYGRTMINGVKLFTYKNIPYHRFKDGTIYSMRNVMDFRPVNTNTSTTTYERIHALPRSKDTMSADVDYYNSSSHIVVIRPNGNITTYNGQETRPTGSKIPREKAGDMLLHTITANPYTISVTDVDVLTTDNSSYTMSDIRKLDRRITNVEELTSLTLLELNTEKLEVRDANGLPRTSLGIMADEFKNVAFSDTQDVSYRSTIDNIKQHVQPRQNSAPVDLIYDSAASFGTIRKGSWIFPVYTEEAAITQTSATSTIPVQQFTVSQYGGKVTLSPAIDNWTQEVKLTINSATTNTEVKVTDAALDDINPIDRSNIDPTYGWADVIGSKTKVTSGRTTVTSGEVDIIKATIQRARFIFFKVENLKPNTKHFIYFNGEFVNKWIQSGAGIYKDFSTLAAGNKYRDPGDQYENATVYPIDGGPTADWANGHVSDASGTIEGVFYVQSSATVNFPTGQVFFTVSDVKSVTNNAWTSFAKTTFSSSGEIDITLTNTYTKPQESNSGGSTGGSTGGGNGGSTGGNTTPAPGVCTGNSTNGGSLSAVSNYTPQSANPGNTMAGNGNSNSNGGYGTRANGLADDRGGAR